MTAVFGSTQTKKNEREREARRARWALIGIFALIAMVAVIAWVLQRQSDVVPSSYWPNVDICQQVASSTNEELHAFGAGVAYAADSYQQAQRLIANLERCGS